jgi:gas vesicle protein
MAGDDFYGDEGYTVVGPGYFKARRGHGRLVSLLFFAAGVMTGVGIGFLAAPHSGRETREQIRKVTTGATEKIATCYTTAVDKAEVALEKGKEIVREKKPLLMSAVEAGMEAYEKEKARMNSAL